MTKKLVFQDIGKIANFFFERAETTLSVGLEMAARIFLQSSLCHAVNGGKHTLLAFAGGVRSCVGFGCAALVVTSRAAVRDGIGAGKIDKSSSLESAAGFAVKRASLTQNCRYF